MPAFKYWPRKRAAEAEKPRWYLIAYDIAHPRRLQKVHKLLKRRGGLPLQKSVFAWLGGDTQRDALIHALEKRIHAKEDDIRLYPIASIEAIVLWGANGAALLADAPPPTTAWNRLKRWIHTVKRRRQARHAFDQMPAESDDDRRPERNRHE